MTIPPDAPRGRRYSLTYLDRGDPSADKPRARMRFAKLLHDTNQFTEIEDQIQSELGLNPPAHNYLSNWQRFIADQPSADFLDIVVIVANVLQAALRDDRYGQIKNDEYINSVRRIFLEENLAYQVDELGGVHPVVDAGLEMTKVSVVRSLDGKEFSNVKMALDEGLAHMNSVPINGKLAIRGVFSAVESLFRLRYPSAPRLAADQISKFLTPEPATIGASDLATAQSLAKLGQSFSAWIDAAHWYRHEQGVEEPHQPPETLAVVIVGEGLSWLRFLADLHKGRFTA